MLEPLGEQAEPGPVPEHDLDEVGLTAPEHEQMPRERILPQHALHQHGKAVDALAHVGIAKSQMHLRAWRKQGHDTCPSAIDVALDGASASVISTATNT